MKKLVFAFCLLITTASYTQKLKAIKIAAVDSLITNTDTTYIINMWATYCAPCVAEIPDMLTIANKYKLQPVKFYFISLDFAENYPKKINAFIKKRKWKSNFLWLNETNADYFCPKVDSTWSGGLPATLIINRKNNFKYFIEDTISASNLEAEIKKSLKITTSN
jgi:thiol-disulfide isomerase/thioredoxin